MKKNFKPLLVICGPTTTGKTDLGIYLAEKLNGEIVSSDSRQIYKGMDIGTGKEISNFKFQISPPKTADRPLDEKVKGYKIGFYKINSIPIWLYDVVNPNQTFSAVEYANLAKTVVDNILKRGKVPIVVGGTGFYIKALADGIDTQIEANWKLRKKLENYKVEKLQEMLRKLDQNRLEKMNNSDKNNPRRLIRAIEIAKNKPIFNFQFSKQKPKFKTFFIGLKTNNRRLYERIDKRVEKRIKQGVLEEIKKLLKSGYKWSDPGMNALGYKQWKEYFDEKETKEKAVQKWKFAEHGYSRRQLTWFKKDKRIKWFEMENLNKESVLSFVQEKLK